MKAILKFVVCILLIGVLFLISCQKELKCENCTIGNQPPIAKAGPDQVLTLPIDSTSLDGSSSSDPDGTISIWLWKKIDGPASFNISNANAVQTKVTNLVQGVYKFELTVTDRGGLFAKDTVQISVNASSIISTCGPRPVINANLVEIGTLSLSRIKLASATVNNKIFFAGGQSAGGYPSRVDIYDITSGTWSTAELSSGDRLGMATATVGNKVLFAGGMENDNGIQTSRVDIYDATTNSWSQAELSIPRADIAAATLGNKVFFAGGTTSNNLGTSRVDIYDNSTNTWTTVNLSQGRGHFTANTMGNKIFFAGGWQGPDATNISTRIDIYDGSNNSWSTAEMQEGKANMASATFNDNIFWAGGWKPGNGFSSSDLVEIRNINTGVSSFSCVIPRTDFNAVTKDDNIIFFTGSTSDAIYGNQFEIYNTTTGIWSKGVLNQRIIYSAIIVVNNTIYVAGGAENGGSSYPVPLNKVWKLVF